MWTALAATLLNLAIFCALSFAADCYNGSFPAWVTAKDVEILQKEMEMKMKEKEQHTFTFEENENSFSSLDGMLRWAIGHSDPEKLSGAALEIQRLSSKELERRQEELKELMEKLQMPSDAELMKIAIADLNNSSLSVDDHHRALHELLVLVEPIDNSNDLNKLGGLAATIRELYREEEELRTTAAWVLGKASQNNPVVQKQILEQGALPKLLTMIRSSCSEEAVKALYAVSAVVRNNHDGQAVFFMEGGGLMLKDLLCNKSADRRLHRKSLLLAADIVEHGLETGHAVSSLLTDKEYSKSVIDLLQVPDLDMQEKVLMALRSLLQLNNTNARVFKDLCHLESALKSLGQQLEELMLDHQWGDFATDLESLRLEVMSIFLTKLESTK